MAKDQDPKDIQTSPAEAEELMSRRDFLRRLRKWSAVVVGAALVGTTALSQQNANAARGAWANARGGGGAWSNRAGGGGGGWVNGAGAGGWVNRWGGGGAWVNR